MAKDGLIHLVSAGALILAVAALPALKATEPDRGDTVAATLAMQTALQQGRDYLQRGDARSAVFVLESQLGRINGNPTYLALLRDAYRAYVKELRQAKLEPEAQRYLQRLQILDPGAGLDAKAAATPPSPPSQGAGPTSPPSQGGAGGVAPTTPLVKAPSAPPAEPKVRMLREDEDAKKAKADPKQKAAGGLLNRAEEEFANRRYREAGALFEQAHQTDPEAVGASRERWAYCKLYRIVEQLNHPPAGGPAFAELEKEARAALQLAPRLVFAQEVLAEIERRRSPAPAGLASQTQITVRHYERGRDGWARAETANFCVYHTQSRELAEQVAQVAEKTRTEMARKWFGVAIENWEPRCEIVLYSTPQEYFRATGVGGESPGHSTFKNEGGRILSRRIDLHCENPPNLLAAILPHETTHVVLYGQFGEQPIPRWADEGMAVLTEPREKIDRHLRNLTRCRQETGLYTLGQLMQMAEYPTEPRYITVFYAQSVSLVEYLCNQKGPQVLTQFLRDAPKIGYEQALTKHYGFKNFEELQQRWNQQVLAAAEGTSSTATVGHGGP
jgi:tetratricopeptide (TPR) repeat protein